jgi:hypothetical protein
MGFDPEYDNIEIGEISNFYIQIVIIINKFSTIVFGHLAKMGKISYICRRRKTNRRIDGWAYSKIPEHLHLSEILTPLIPLLNDAGQNAGFLKQPLW